MMFSCCMICSKKHSEGQFELSLLRNIQSIIQSNTKQNSELQSICHQYDNTYNFYHTFHCDYGLSCTTLRNMEIKLNRIGQDINLDLGMFCLTADLSIVKKVQQSCRGYYPNAYCSIDRYLALRKHIAGD